MMNRLILITTLLTASLPGLCSAQKAYKQEHVDKLRAGILDAKKNLAQAEEQLQVLFRHTTPVVRQPEALVEELVRIERDLFESSLQQLRVRNEVDALTERLETAQKDSEKPVPQRLAIRRAEAAVKKAELRYEARQQELQVMTIRVETGDNPQNDLRKAREESETAALELELAKSDLEAVKQQHTVVVTSYTSELEKKLLDLRTFEEIRVAQKKRADKLRDIYDECFEYQRLADSEIPALQEELADLSAELRKISLRQKLSAEQAAE